MSANLPEAPLLSLKCQKSLPSFQLNIDAQIPLHGVTAIFGPSGAGKSTLLRLIAGLDKPDQGTITMAGECWFNSANRHSLPPAKRPVGTMFQDGRLFSHLSVQENLYFAHKRSAEVSQSYSFAEIVQAFSLKELLARHPAALSGGEQQRVALARTLLSRPALLLLDEPLAGLDQQRKREILPFLETLPKRFGLPCLYVSHDIDEVSHLTDQMLVLAQGQVQHQGPTTEIMNQLDLHPLAGRNSASSFLDGHIQAHDPAHHITTVQTSGGVFILPLSPRLTPNTKLRLRIRAQDVAIATQRPEAISIQNILPGTIQKIIPNPKTGHVDVLLNLGSNTQLRARITHAATQSLRLKPDMTVFALIKAVSFDTAL